MAAIRLSVRTVTVGAMVLAAGMTPAQDFPSKPVCIVTAAPGGGTDFAARLVSPGLPAVLGQQVIVDNRANALVASDAVAKAAPDGYTLLVNGNSFWIVQLLQKVPYDVVRDFLPISQLVREVSVLVVHPSLPVKSLKELIALSKAKPKELSYSAGSIGGPNHLGMELLKSMTGVDILHVPYKGSGAARTGLIAGEVHMMITDVGSVIAQTKVGRLRALAVTSAAPSPLFPGLPTMAASGLPGYEMTGISGIWAPAKTPGTVINRLNQEIVRVLNQPDVKEKASNAGVEIVGSSPEQIASTIKSEIANWSKVIKEAGIKVE